MPGLTCTNVMRNDWLHTNTFHHSQFQDLWELVSRKEAQGLTISLCLPTCNAAATIGRNVVILKSELMTCYPLVDEIVVLDVGSTDTTCEIVAAFGAKVYQTRDILSEKREKYGKDDSAWQAADQFVGDILVYLDGSIPDIQPYMVAGLVGPLLYHPHIQYVNAFYDHPLAYSEESRPFDQEYLPEVFVHSLFSLFFPELNTIIHPLSRVYAVRHMALEHVPFIPGYEVEISHLISVYRRYGLDALGQTDLDQLAYSHPSLRDQKQVTSDILCTTLAHLSYQEIVNQIEALMHIMFIILSLIHL